MSDQRPYTPTTGNSGGTTPELLLLLGRIDGKLDLALTNHAELAKRVDANDERHTQAISKVEQRVHGMEKRQSYLMGGIAVVAASATHGVKYLIAVITGH